ncbi:MAG: 50S ribosomal protein L24 [Proteobacteria bacterium]|nr:50S ribosomal protein L24 [Pseudomonadota bacterium]MCH8977419.1 50S ribosomal protein L24 [Pseudomonadota bacterium]
MRKISKGDEVVVLAGKDKGKRGVVLKVMQELEKVIVENINMVKRHTKGNPMQGTPGGIVEKEMPLHISNVAIWNPVSGKADRVGVKTLKDGQKVRFFKSNDEVVDV